MKKTEKSVEFNTNEFELLRDIMVKTTDYLENEYEITIVEDDMPVYCQLMFELITDVIEKDGINSFINDGEKKDRIAHRLATATYRASDFPA